jgi:hypothetical protein
MAARAGRTCPGAVVLGDALTAQGQGDRQVGQHRNVAAVRCLLAPGDALGVYCVTTEMARADSREARMAR